MINDPFIRLIRDAQITLACKYTLLYLTPVGDSLPGNFYFSTWELTGYLYD